MRFSILVPVYNVEEFLKECLDSILKQTYQDYEVILVDDGSTDSSGKICDEYQKICPDKIRVIHKQNQGLISARRVGISEAKGEFCIFVDSDDYVEDILLEKINSCIENDLEIDMLIYSFSYLIQGKKENRRNKVANDGVIWSGENKCELYEKISCSSEITSIWSKAIRTSILKEDPTDYTFYYGKNMAEDLLQSLYPLTAARKIMYVDYALYNYRINDKSISHNFNIKKLDAKKSVHVYEKIKDYLVVWEMKNDVMLNKVYAKWFNDTMFLFSEYYKKITERNQKRELVLYDWKSWLPKEGFNKDNPFINKKYLKLFILLEKRSFRKIEYYFLFQRLKKDIKNTKKFIKGKIKDE